MAKFEGIKCDNCGSVVAKEDAVEKLVRYKGTEVNGEYTTDLCAKCGHDDVPAGVELKPWPRMKAGDSPIEA
jgi:uncharacterized OB-fold protein